MSVAEVSYLPSIQQEKLGRPAEYVPLTDQESDEYVDTHSDELVDCRVGRHPFPVRRRRGVIDFTGEDRNGNLIREDTCPCCGCATRRETWAAFPIPGRRKEYRWERISKTMYYHKNAKGETYLLPPGSGRGKPTQFMESRMTAALKGQSPDMIRKQLAKERNQ